MRLNIALFPGDGIGPEVFVEAVKVLNALKLDCNFTTSDVGACAIYKHGSAMAPGALQMAQEADAVLFGAVGAPEFDANPKATVRPEQAILGLRKGLELFANLRPVKVYEALLHASPLKPEIVRGTDMIILRELTGGSYFGEPKFNRGSKPNREASDSNYYTEGEIRRLMVMAFELARGRRNKVTSADKANVMASGRLWREVANEVRAEFPDVQYEDVFADALSMHILKNPRGYDVCAMDNLFGDILSDEASQLTGSLGMLPSASLGADRNQHGHRRGLYEPIHGAAHDITGKGIANPLAMILSVALMLRWSFGLHAEADRIEAAVNKVLVDGLRCGDIKSEGTTVLGTKDMGDAVVARL